MIVILQVKDRASEQHGKLLLYDTEWGLLTRQSGKPREFTTRTGARGARSRERRPREEGSKKLLRGVSL